MKSTRRMNLLGLFCWLKKLKVHISCQHLQFWHTKSDTTCPVYILSFRNDSRLSMYSRHLQFSIEHFPDSFCQFFWADMFTLSKIMPIYFTLTYCPNGLPKVSSVFSNSHPMTCWRTFLTIAFFLISV